MTTEIVTTMMPRAKKPTRLQKRPRAPPSIEDAVEILLQRPSELQIASSEEPPQPSKGTTKTMQETAKTHSCHDGKTRRQSLEYLGGKRTPQQLWTPTSSFLVCEIALYLLQLVEGQRKEDIRGDDDDKDPDHLPNEIVLVAGKSIMCLNEVASSSFSARPSTESTNVMHLAFCVELGYMGARLKWVKKGEATAASESTREEQKQPHESAQVATGRTKNNGDGFWILQVYVLPDALQRCNSQVLPFNRITHALKYQHANWIQKAILNAMIITMHVANQSRDDGGTGQTTTSLSLSVGPTTMTSKVRASSSPTVRASSSPTVRASSSPTVRASSSPTVRASSSPTVRASSSCEHDRHTGSVTAKHVYDWTDNVQLERALQRQQQQENQENPPTPLDIPGLLPTLRPYQSMAVEWMLQRERSPTPLDEWKLAWVVFAQSSSCHLDDPCCFLPLKEWEDKQRSGGLHHLTTATKKKMPLLLFCPVVGWLATSIEEARDMSLDYDENSNCDFEDDMGNNSNLSLVRGVKGGILAESMGLGKTVEVLACILAHRRRLQAVAVDNAASPRRILFASDQESSSLSGQSSTQQQQDAKDDECSNNVGDVGEIGDAEDDDEENADSSSVQPIGGDEVAKQQAIKNIPSPQHTMSQTRETSAVPVTPDVDDGDNPPTSENEQRWLDEGETLLGSCLCGDVLHIQEATNVNPIVLCCQCKQPTHMDCAGIASQSELKQMTRPITYRKMFSDQSWTCYETLQASHQWFCPYCCAGEHRQDKKKLIPSRATLIVTPPAILTQWEREIERHAQDPTTHEPLRVAIYHGVDKTTKSRPKLFHSGSSNGMKLLHPHSLADHDIVLVTFDALLSDFGHAADENRFVGQGDSGNSVGWLRKRKRYRVVPSPLSAIDFWRVCLDEAQRVERPTAMSARMALKLHGQHRWCVTGTPVGRGQLQDLYGLLLFLRMPPFSHKAFFTKALEESAVPSHPIPMSHRIQTLLGNVFWRSTKLHPVVRKQMGVPEQIEMKQLLKFSSVERHFYERQLEATLATAGDFCERRRKGQQDKVQHLNLLADHLHRLRAACCHPQVGAGGITSNSMTNSKKRSRRSSKKKKTGSMATLTNNSSSSEGGVSNVLTMEEILVRLIDDARLKCEESQRLVIMHTNGMAALSRLQVEARERGHEFPQLDDDTLLVQSCKMYMESLDLAGSNSRPTPILANGNVSGSKGFCSPNRQLQGGKTARLDWKLMANSTGRPQQHSFWARIDFEGSARRVTRVKLRPILQVPKALQEQVSTDFEWAVLLPKVCTLEVSSAALGEEFIPVTQLACPVNNEPDAQSDSWIVPQDKLHTLKSKSWRIVVESCHKRHDLSPVMSYYVGVEVVLEEADIASDSLQTLHALHNASLSFTALLQLRDAEARKDETKKQDGGIGGTKGPVDDGDKVFLSVVSMKENVTEMTTKAEHIESLYMQVAKSLHIACHQRFLQSVEARKKAEESLRQLMPILGKTKRSDCWDAGWWDEFLVACHLYGEDTQDHGVCRRMQEELDHIQSRNTAESGVVKFPTFRDIHGLKAALQSRLTKIRTTGIGKATSWVNTMEDGVFQIRKDRFHCQPGMHAKCMDEISDLSPSPSPQELYANSHCRVCKADWNQQGPKCRHCVIGDQLNELEPDRVTLLLMNTLHVVLRGPIGSAVVKSVIDNTGGAPNWLDCAKAFFDVLEAQKREKVLAWRYWRTHLDLLNDLDELNQCKESIRLAYNGEDWSQLTREQQNAVVLPCDVRVQYHDHAAKQAMALGDLRRCKETLRYLRNQQQEQEQQLQALMEDEAKPESVDTCVVCLSPFESTDRAVLRCGHYFHASPCLERLTSRSKNIRCPMRCRVSTSIEQVLIASKKRRDDGSRIQRKDVRGSWGTKVSQVVADLLDIRDRGEKAILFSQWEDMLDIVAQALTANTVSLVKASSRAKIGEALTTFRTNEDCTVLMLNVKHGAEGLTVLEARHVLMLEPLLNHALDMQAINRVSRIGQTQQTTVHRYVVKDTVEEKIDSLRMACADDDGVVEDTMATKPTIRAGGVDGGFTSENELMDLLALNQ